MRQQAGGVLGNAGDPSRNRSLIRGAVRPAAYKVILIASSSTEILHLMKDSVLGCDPGHRPLVP